MILYFYEHFIVVTGATMFVWYFEAYKAFLFHFYRENIIHMAGFPGGCLGNHLGAVLGGAPLPVFPPLLLGIQQVGRETSHICPVA